VVPSVCGAPSGTSQPPCVATGFYPVGGGTGEKTDGMKCRRYMGRCGTDVATGFLSRRDGMGGAKTDGM